MAPTSAAQTHSQLRPSVPDSAAPGESPGVLSTVELPDDQDTIASSPGTTKSAATTLLESSEPLASPVINRPPDCIWALDWDLPIPPILQSRCETRRLDLFTPQTTFASLCRILVELRKQPGVRVVIVSRRVWDLCQEKQSGTRQCLSDHTELVQWPFWGQQTGAEQPKDQVSTQLLFRGDDSRRFKEVQTIVQVLGQMCLHVPRCIDDPRTCLLPVVLDSHLGHSIMFCFNNPDLGKLFLEMGRAQKDERLDLALDCARSFWEIYDRFCTRAGYPDGRQLPGANPTLWVSDKKGDDAACFQLKEVLGHKLTSQAYAAAARAFRDTVRDTEQGKQEK